MPNRSKRDDSPHRAAAGELSRVIKQARTRLGLSQQQAASSANVAIGTLRALEGGRSVDPSFFTVLALTRVLHVDLSELANYVTAVIDRHAPMQEGKD